MYGQPWYNNFPPNVSYNPYLHSSYKRPSPFQPLARDPPYYDDRLAEERRRALAERRARRAQWLPDEQDDEDDYEDDAMQWNDYQRRNEDDLIRQRTLDVQRKLQEQQRQEAIRRQEEQRGLEELREREELRRRKLREEEELRRQKQSANQHKGNRNFGAAPRFPQASRQEDTSTPVPIHIRPHPSRSRHASPSPSPQAQGVQRSGSDEQSRRNPSRSPSPTQSPAPQAQPTHTAEERNEAAARIQKQFRVHSSFRTLSQLEAQFNKLRKDFIYPSKIDFQNPDSDSVITVLACRAPSEFDKEIEEASDSMQVDSTGKLAFTSVNYALNAYSDALDKLLIKLDGVESWGEKRIRLRRRAIVKDIEKEASKLDRYWKQAWADYIEKHQLVEPVPIPAEANQLEPDTQRMEVDSVPQAQDQKAEEQESSYAVPIQEGPVRSMVNEDDS